MQNTECHVKWAINQARTIERITGCRADYCEFMRMVARNALSAANRSGDKKRKSAAMRAINYYGRESAKARAAINQNQQLAA